jgi:hypothetical protein
MKRKKLLHKLRDLLDMEGQKQRKHHKELKKLLDKLKEKEHELQQELEDEKSDRKRERLRKEIEIVHAQRKKGLTTLREAQH